MLKAFTEPYAANRGRRLGASAQHRRIIETARPERGSQAFRLDVLRIRRLAADLSPALPQPDEQQ